MNRRDLVKAIAAHTDVDAKTVDAVLKGFTDVTTHVVAKGEPVAITGFAKFAKVERAARMGRNPATGEALKIKASQQASITPPKGLPDAVMPPSQPPTLATGPNPPAPTKQYQLCRRHSTTCLHLTPQLRGSRSTPVPR